MTVASIWAEAWQGRSNRELAAAIWLCLLLLAALTMRSVRLPLIAAAKIIAHWKMLIVFGSYAVFVGLVRPRFVVRLMWESVVHRLWVQTAACSAGVL